MAGFAGYLCSSSYYRSFCSGLCVSIAPLFFVLILAIYVLFVLFLTFLFHFPWLFRQVLLSLQCFRIGGNLRKTPERKSRRPCRAFSVGRGRVFLSDYRPLFCADSCIFCLSECRF